MGKLQLHPVFHTSFLKPYNSRDDSVVDTPVEVALGDGSEGYLVEAIIGKRRRRGITEYRVKWLGTSEITWEPMDNLFQVSGLITEFESKQKHSKN